jgi:hypothetical protein
VMAIIERHGERPSTRFKDLIDLVAIVTEVSIDESKHASTYSQSCVSAFPSASR